MSEQKAPSVDKTARRRLLRGAFAVPAVMAVSSGQALAQTSSALRCIANQVATPVTAGIAPTTTSAQPGLLRVQLHALKKTVGNMAIDSYWVRGIDLEPYGTGAFLTMSQFQKFNLAENKLEGSATSTQPTKSQHAFVSVAQYVVVRFNDKGEAVGVGTSGGMYASSPVAASCWNSFNVA